MKKIEVLLLSKQAKPAALFQEIAKVFPVSLVTASPEVFSIGSDLSAVRKALEKSESHFIFIDGNYGAGDSTKLAALSTLDDASLGERFYPTTKKEFPTSIKLLWALRALRNKRIVVFFCDGPSFALGEELKYAGATAVYPNLSAPSVLSKSFFTTVFRGTQFVRSAAEFGKNIFAGR